MKLEVPEAEKPQKLVPKKRGKGRPPKTELEAVKNRKKDKPGPHPGDAARIQEFKARLLATGGTRIIDKLVSIALDDNHPGQTAMLKLVADRLIPVSLFETVKNGSGTPHISINITSMGSPELVQESPDDDFIVDVTPK